MLFLLQKKRWILAIAVLCSYVVSPCAAQNVHDSISQATLRQQIMNGEDVVNQVVIAEDLVAAISEVLQLNAGASVSLTACRIIGDLQLAHMATTHLQADLPKGLRLHLEGEADTLVDVVPSSMSLRFSDCKLSRLTIKRGMHPLLLESELCIEDSACESVVLKESLLAGHVSFEQCSLGYVLVDGCVFLHEASFREASIRLRPQYLQSEFAQPADFSNAVFESGGSFYKIAFGDRVKFEGVLFKGPVELEETTFWKPQDEALAHLLASKTWLDAGESEKGYKYWYRYKVANRKRKPLYLRSLELVFLDLPSAYGTSWKRVLLTWCVIILVWGFMYWIARGLTQAPICKTRLHRDIRGFLACVYFSVVTFTTLGYGDHRPTGFSRVLASLQALLGAVLISLFVVVLARVYL